mgnify:CR=1 FL=1
MKRILLIFLLLIIVTLLNLFGSKIRAQSCTDISDLNERISCLEGEVSKLKNQGATLANQVAQFDTQIRLTQLKISQTEEKISLLGGRIDQLEGSLDALTNAFSSRAVETYKMSRLGDPAYIIISAPNLNEAMSRFHYLQRIQESDQDLLQRLTSAQNTYKNEKVDQEELQEQLQKQKAELDSQRRAKNTLLAETKNSESKYQSLLNQAKAQLAAMRRFVTTQGGATILSNQTKCDSWGCYYNQRDAEWGNLGLGGSSYSVAGYGCLVSSVSMIASHYGKNIKPGNIAVIGEAFVPGTGYLYHSFSVNGVKVSISSASRDNLDSYLNSGQPVIAGLYSGPDHFIVILRKDGNNYIMHDPFLENGGNRNLSDKYSVSDISSLRLVSFN